MPYLQRAFVREDKVSLLAFVVRPPAVAGVKPKVMKSEVPHLTGTQIFFPFSSLSRQDKKKTYFFFNFTTEFKFYISTNLTLSTLSKLLIQAECLNEMIAYSTQS